MAQSNLLREIEKVPAGEWIALSADETRLITHGPNLAAVIEDARRQGVEDPVMMRAAPIWTSFVIAG